MQDGDSPEREHQDESQGYKKKSLRRSWAASGPVAKLTAVFAGVAAVATVIYTAAAVRQLIVMSGQLSELKRSGASATDQMWHAIGNIHWMAKTMDVTQRETLAEMRSQSQAMQKSADATQRTANTTAGALALAQEAQQPWVGIVGATIRISEQPKFSKGNTRANFGAVVVWLHDFSFDIKNFGNSPAIQVSQTEMLWIPKSKGLIEYGGNPPYNWDGDYTCQRADDILDAHPPEGLFYQSETLMPSEQIPIAEQHASGMSLSYTTLGTPRIWIVGCIAYTGRGERYYTRFQAAPISHSLLANPPPGFEVADDITSFRVMVQRVEKKKRSANNTTQK